MDGVLRAFKIIGKKEKLEGEKEKKKEKKKRQLEADGIYYECIMLIFWGEWHRLLYYGLEMFKR